MFFSHSGIFDIVFGTHPIVFFFQFLQVFVIVFLKFVLERLHLVIFVDVLHFFQSEPLHFRLKHSNQLVNAGITHGFTQFQRQLHHGSRFFLPLPLHCLELCLGPCYKLRQNHFFLDVAAEDVYLCLHVLECSCEVLLHAVGGHFGGHLVLPHRFSKIGQHALDDIAEDALGLVFEHEWTEGHQGLESSHLAVVLLASRNATGTTSLRHLNTNYINQYEVGRNGEQYYNNSKPSNSSFYYRISEPQLFKACSILFYFCVLRLIQFQRQDTIARLLGNVFNILFIKKQYFYYSLHNNSFILLKDMGCQASDAASPIQQLPTAPSGTKDVSSAQVIRPPQKKPSAQNTSSKNPPTQNVFKNPPPQITSSKNPSPQNVTTIPSAALIQDISLTQKMVPAQTIPVEFGEAVQRLIEDYSIVKEVMGLLSRVAYSQDQLTYVANAIVDNVLILEQKQSAEERKRVESLFTEEKKNLIKEGKLYFHALKEQFLESERQKDINNIRMESISRIFHTVANIKRESKIDQRKENQFGILCQKSNHFYKLNDKQLEQVVQFQAVGHYTEKVGGVLKFKYNSILQESNNIKRLLSECFKKHQKAIQSLKFNLSEAEIMEVALISRDACNYYENGVYLLLVYLVTSCKKLENGKQSLKSIEEKMQKALDLVSAKYPPGQGLKEEQKEQAQALKSLALKDKFAHQPQQLQPQGKPKQEQAEEIIMKYAKIAKSNREHFEELVSSTCLKKCLETHIGLKYNPDNPNKKALTRIKEKMFFKKDAVIKREPKANIKQTLNSEETAYKLSIDENLEKMTEIRFSISDMVRGKCTFLEITDIIETINDIKNFVRDDPQKRFRITEIESRFTNAIPISDVTLKIAIKEEIVAELQLTIQNNMAAYNFAHKIYELHRTKVFSKVKIAHNYLEEYQKEFRELVKQSLQIAGNQGSGSGQAGQISPSAAKAIEQYFGLKSFQKKSFKQVLEKVLFNRLKEAKSIPALSVCTDKNLQDLILPIFNKEMGKWDKELGSEINAVLLKNQHSRMLKATLLYFFFKSFRISTEIHKMMQFLQVYEGSTAWMSIIVNYFKEVFGIEGAFDYNLENQNIFYKGQQFYYIQLNRDNFSYCGVSVRLGRLVQNTTVEEESPQKVSILRQLTGCFFDLRDQNGKIVDQFQKYYNWLLLILKKQPKLDTGIIASEAKLLMAQKFLIEDELEKAKSLIEQSRDNFKRKQVHLKAMQCQLFLAECKLRLQKPSFEEFKQYYDKEVRRKALTLGLELQGASVSNSEWRIAKALFNICKGKQEKKHILDVHCRWAITESSRTEEQELILKMQQVWAQFKECQIQEPEILSNKAIKSINFYQKKIGDQGCYLMSRAKWNNLEGLNLSYNKIGVEGCSYLSKAGWKNLKQLRIRNNNIGKEGIAILVKLDWKNLKELDLSANKLGPQGCEAISKADWSNLEILSLSNNQIGDEGCAHLSKANWKNMFNVRLGFNGIGDNGCAHVAKADWKKMSFLNLSSNRIGDEGCAHLSKGDWKKLGNLDLSTNKIGDEGCTRLGEADWKNLQFLDLNGNSISQEKEKQLRSKFGLK